MDRDVKQALPARHGRSTNTAGSRDEYDDHDRARSRGNRGKDRLPAGRRRPRP